MTETEINKKTSICTDQNEFEIKQTLAEGFYSVYRTLHHTPLSDIDFQSL